MRQVPADLWKRRKSLLFILCQTIAVGNTDTSKDPGFVDVKSTTIKTKDFKSQRNTS